MSVQFRDGGHGDQLVRSIYSIYSAVSTLSTLQYLQYLLCNIYSIYGYTRVKLRQFPVLHPLPGLATCCPAQQRMVEDWRTGGQDQHQGSAQDTRSTVPPLGSLRLVPAQPGPDRSNANNIPLPCTIPPTRSALLCPHNIDKIYFRVAAPPPHYSSTDGC